MEGSGKWQGVPSGAAPAAALTRCLPAVLGALQAERGGGVHRRARGERLRAGHREGTGLPQRPQGAASRLPEVLQ